MAHTVLVGVPTLTGLYSSKYSYVSVYVYYHVEECPSGRPMWSQLLGQLRFGCFMKIFCNPLANDSLGSRLGYGCILQLFLATLIIFWPMKVLDLALATAVLISYHLPVYYYCVMC